MRLTIKCSIDVTHCSEAQAQVKGMGGTGDVTKLVIRVWPELQSFAAERAIDVMSGDL